MRKHINQGAERVTLWIKGSPNEWDLMSPQFRKAIHSYLLQDNIAVDLILPTIPTDTDLKQDLYRLTSVGAKLCEVLNQNNPHIIAQIHFSDKLVTIASEDSDALTPGNNWHQASKLVVESLAIKPIEFAEVSNNTWIVNSSAKTFDLEISSELNGDLSGLGEKFWRIVNDQNEEIGKLISEIPISEISYSDRYIQNPSACALLSSFLKPLIKEHNKKMTIEISTLFKSRDRNGNRAFHDWANQDSFKNYSEQWLSTKLNCGTTLNIAGSNRDIPHYRKLLIKFESGQTVKVRFDQGVAYWNIRFDQAKESFFDFDDDLSFLLAKMSENCERARVMNSESWSTNVVVEVI